MIRRIGQMERKITFVTHNEGKVASAQKHFTAKNIQLDIYRYDLDEPRSEDIGQIAKAKVRQAYNLIKQPCFALDTGFYIEALHGFPKTFINFSLETIGIDGILKLMKGVKNRKCYFKECLAYMQNDNPQDIEYFFATIPGTLALEKRGRNTVEKWSDLWYIFIPENYSLTLSEMTKEEREKRTEINRAAGKLSAIEQLAAWL